MHLQPLVHPLPEFKVDLMPDGHYAIRATVNGVSYRHDVYISSPQQKQMEMQPAEWFDMIAKVFRSFGVRALKGGTR